MIWLGLAVMGVVAFGYLKMRRQRKATVAR